MTMRWALWVMAPLLIAIPKASEAGQKSRTSAKDLRELRLSSRSAECIIEAVPGLTEIELESDDDDGPELARDEPRLSIRARDGDLHLRIPADFSLELSSISGDLKISGRFKRIDLHSISGDLELRLSSDRIDLETISGDIQLEGQTGELRISTTSGDMKLRGLAPKRMEVHTVSGGLDYHGRIDTEAVIAVRTVSGDVRFNIEGQPGFLFDARTRSGSIRVAREITGAQAIKTDQRLEQRIGSGGANLRVVTLSGDIEIGR